MPSKHARILAVLLIFYALIHVFVFGHFLLLVYTVSVIYGLWITMVSFMLVGTPLLITATTTIAGFALAARRSWARVALLIVILSALAGAAQMWWWAGSNPSVDRLVWLVPYWAACLGICTYSTWLLWRKALK